MELRDQIARIIESSIRVRTKRINGVETALVDDLNLAADRILALPEIKEAFEAVEKLEAVGRVIFVDDTPLDIVMRVNSAINGVEDANDAKAHNLGHSISTRPSGD